MNILAAIWAFLKNLYTSNTKGAIFLEILKILFSVVIGYYLCLLLTDYTQVPIRDYQIEVKNLKNINLKDKLSLNVNIEFGWNLADYYKKNTNYAVSLDVDSEYEIDDSCRAKGFYTHDFSYTRFPNNSLQLTSKSELDTVSVIYLINTKQFQIPTFDINLLKPDTTYENISSDEEKFDKSIGHFNNFRMFMATIVKIDTDKVDNIFKYESETLIMQNEGGHDFVYQPPQALAITRFDLFSRKDISQSDYHFRVRLPQHSDSCEVKFDFSGATDFSSMHPEPDIKTMTGFSYTDQRKIKQLSKDGLWFHAKFYQLENLQNVRLFFLTTVLGIMLGLLLSSIWNLIKMIVVIMMN